MKKHMKNIVEVLSYAGICISIWYFTYFQLNCAKEDINVEYQMFSFIFLISITLFYRDSRAEVTKEIFKSGIILVVTNTMQLYLQGDITYEKICTMLITQVVYHLIAYASVWIFAREKQLMLEKYVCIIIPGQIVTAAVFCFVLNVHIVASYLGAVGIWHIIGWFFYKKTYTINKLKEQEELIKTKEEILKEIEYEKYKKENKELKEKNQILQDKNKKLQGEITLKHNKDRRKRAKNRRTNKCSGKI